MNLSTLCDLMFAQVVMLLACVWQVPAEAILTGVVSFSLSPSCRVQEQHLESRQ
jgi:hypothetical protein